MKINDMLYKIKRDDYDKISKIYFLKIPIYKSKSHGKPGIKEFEKELNANENNHRKNILFVTHDFSLTGAPLAIFNTATALSKKYNIFVIGFNAGVLLSQYKENDIKVFVDKKFNSVSPRNILNFNKFDFVFTNTVLTYNIVNCLSEDKPYLWRIAEGIDIKNNYIHQCPHLAETLSKAKSLYAVSLYTKNILMQFNDKVNLLLYGIKDVSAEYEKNIENSEIIKFAVIGSWSERKAQELILKAYNQLPSFYQDKAGITFIGNNPNQYKDYKNIRFVGSQIDKAKYDILSECDVLLCPSLDDPNPQVVMEGMMLSKPCLISDAVGQKDYITDGQNGWVIKAGDINALSEKLKFIIDNPQEIKRISPLSRKIFEEYFSFTTYLENVQKIIEKDSK